MPTQFNTSNSRKKNFMVKIHSCLTLSVVLYPCITYHFISPNEHTILFTENEMQIVVTWTTFNKTDSIVEYGINRLSTSIKGQMTRFFDKGDSNRTWYIHRVSLDNLKPGVKYCKCRYSLFPKTVLKKRFYSLCLCL